MVPWAAPARLRTTRKLAAAGDTALLDYHLAAMRDLGAPPLLTDNSAELLIDGPRTYRAMFAAIEQAREYIFVESFIFEEAVEGDRRLSELLRQAAARGVHIYVLYDAIGSLTTEAQFLEGLKSGGIALCAFNPLNPLDDRFAGLNQRDHRKIFVVDGEQAFAGGMNFSHAYRDCLEAGAEQRAVEAEVAGRRLAGHAHRHARARGAQAGTTVPRAVARGGLRRRAAAGLRRAGHSTAATR